MRTTPHHSLGVLRLQLPRLCAACVHRDAHQEILRSVLFSVNIQQFFGIKGVRHYGWPHRAQAEMRAMIVMLFQRAYSHNPIVSRWRSSCRAIAQIESLYATSSAATMMRVRVSMSRAYPGLVDFHGDNARSCCLWNSLARCSGVSD